MIARLPTETRMYDAAATQFGAFGAGSTGAAKRAADWVRGQTAHPPISLGTFGNSVAGSCCARIQRTNGIVSERNRQFGGNGKRRY